MRHDPRIRRIPDWVNNGNIRVWREQLKRTLLIERDYRSDWSGVSFMYAGCHLHEGIITRATVPASISWHYLIFHPYNSVLLLPDEHIPLPPSREWCIRHAYDLYGRDAVLTWYYALPFKAFPYQLP